MLSGAGDEGGLHPGLILGPALGILNVALSLARGQEVSWSQVALCVIPGLGMAKLAMVAKTATRAGAMARTGLSVTNVAMGGLGVVGIMENGEAAYAAFSKGDILGGINAVADAAHGAKGVRAGVRSATTMATGVYSPCQGQKLRPWNIDQSSCFAAGTPIRLPDGTSKPIEMFEVGDAILTKPKFEVDGVVQTGAVAAVWKSVAVIVNLHVGGGYIETTQDHPFYVRGFGWKAAHELRSGDELRTSVGWTAFEAVAPSGRVETVYNLTVVEHHTYFVGGDVWGFELWAHNGFVRYVGDRTAPRVPTYNNKKATGVLRINGVDVTLVSGRSGTAASMPSVARGMNGITKTHVEGHAAAVMHQTGVRSATLYINRVPCAGAGGCDRLLPRMLPTGATLTVLGPNNFFKVYTGG